MSRMRVDLTADRSVTVAAGDITLFRYAYGAPHPHLTGGLLPSPVTWSPPHKSPGTARHVTLTELSATATTATIAHHLQWPAVDEWRSLTASGAGHDTWLLLLENTVTNATGRPLALDGPALSLPALTAPPAGRAEWRAAHSATATVVVVDDNANLQHPPRWSAGLGPAPLEGVSLGADRTAAFRYAVLIAPPGHHAPTLAGLGRDALAGPLPAPRGHLCHADLTSRRPPHRSRTRVLTRRCKARTTPPTP
ncbi:hypothetical protein [Actinoplanes palleronii]|nr:hypothetical protein [Actinoplanes palleronii]